MAKSMKSETLGGEVLEKAAETAKAEQYWILADKSEPRDGSGPMENNRRGIVACCDETNRLHWFKLPEVAAAIPLKLR